jgi:hypothetical protein
MPRQVPLNACNYVIEYGDTPKHLAEWKQLHCDPYLDAANTHRLARIFWLPDSLLTLRRHWTRICLYAHE